MNNLKHRLNRADGESMGGEGYAFGTLWQEATNAVGHVVNGVVNGLQVTERTKQLKEYYGLKRQEENHAFLQSVSSGGRNSSDIGFYFVVILFIAVLAGGLWFAFKKAKQ